MVFGSYTNLDCQFRIEELIGTVVLGTHKVCYTTCSQMTIIGEDYFDVLRLTL